MRFIAGLICFLFFTGAIRAQSTSAADAYRIAGNAIPTLLTELEKHLLENSIDAPLDESVNKLVERSAKSLDMFDVASQMPFGIWGYDLNEPMTAGRLLPGAMSLADLVTLRARLRATSAKPNVLLDEAYKLALLARRIGVQPSLPRLLQQNAMLDRSAQLAGLAMLDVSPVELKAFLERLNELRSPPDSIDVIEAEERAYLAYHHQLVENSFLRRIADEGIGPFNSLFGGQIAQVNVDDLLGDDEATNVAFLQAEQAFTEVIAALKVPPADRPVEIAAAHIRIKASHPLAQTAMQIVDQCLRAGQLQEMQLNLIRTAINICANPQRPVDPEKARSLAQAERFDFLPTADGFTLKWRDQGQLNPPMTIQVRQGVVRASATTSASIQQPARRWLGAPTP